MTYNIAKYPQTEASVLKALRRLVPQRPLDFEEAKQIADYFAGCLLMPTMQLKRLFYRGIQKPTELAAHFQVSARAVQFRLRQTGIAERARRCNTLYQRRGILGYNRREMARVAV